MGGLDLGCKAGGPVTSSPSASMVDIVQVELTRSENSRGSKSVVNRIEIEVVFYTVMKFVSHAGKYSQGRRKGSKWKREH